MPIIKCKMCGGDIEISADKTFGTCEYCGSTMTLPKVDDEQRAAAFNRGNHFRRSGEFDKALAVYERIVAEDDNDAEAHWCCALCRFGIEYVEDPATYEWLPTCHRASFDSFLEDVDYLAALEHSDGITRRQYQKDAAKIAEVQRGILATSQNEQPFDVFLCYKETGEDGQRTRDSLMAQEVYYELTEQGYRVFFARITLEDKAGAEYEPYIFAALNSAKVMVVIGTKPEHFNAVWVKNEWSRFLSMMKKDRSKLLLPCYRDMDPYDLPEALSVLQSYDMSKIGFMQDLIRGVKKVVDAAKPQETVTETVKETVVVHNEGGSNVQALLKRGNMALEDGEWGKADEFFEQVLNQDAECGAAYLGKFLASKKAKNILDFVKSYLSTVEADAPTENDAEACPEDTGFIEACAEKYAIESYLAKKEIHQWLYFDRTYCTTRPAFFQRAADTAKELLDSDRNFTRAEKYSSGESKEQCEELRTGLVDTLHQKEEESKRAEQAEQERIAESYRVFLRDTEQRLAVRQKECLAQKQADDDEKQRRRMIEEKLAQEEAARKAKKIKIGIIIGGIAMATIAGFLVVTLGIIPSINYSKAADLRAAGDYNSAIAEYEALGDYKDASDHAKECWYLQAEQLQSTGDITHAAIAFGKSSGYKDATERSFALWETIAEHNTIATDLWHTVGLKADGTVADTNDNSNEKYAASDWNNIVAVSAVDNQTIGLKANGTVVATRGNSEGQFDVSDWDNIVAVSAYHGHTVGLKADGTVIAVGNNSDGRCDVSDWSNIVAVSTNLTHTVGLKADGTVVATGDNSAGQCNVSAWSNIVAVSAGDNHTVGLKADGTVIAIGDNSAGKCNIFDWSNIVAVSAGFGHTVGLKADGTVVAVGANAVGQCNVFNWNDIVAVLAGETHSVGLKADGTVVATGNNSFGQCDVSDWSDIKLPNK